MIRRKGPILAAAVIAAFALGWYRGLFGTGPVATDGPPAPAEPAQVASEAGRPTKPTAAEPAMSTQAGQGTPALQPTASDAGGAAAQATAAPEPATPGFDIVRVEPDGSAVVAGRGAANERIALTDGTRTLGEAQTDANGDFVMSLSIPSGSHRLQLAQRDDVISDDAAVVNVPPAGQPEQLLVMMERPGEASEVLQRPAATAAASPVAPTAREPTAQPGQDGPEQVAAVAPTVPSQPAAPAEPASAAEATLSVEAVEIEGDRLSVAGSAASQSTVRLYLDDAFVGEARSGEGDRFVANSRVDVPVGDHRIRADVLDSAGRVVGRAEVPFRRPEGRSMAAIAAPPSAAPPSVAPPSTVASQGESVALTEPADRPAAKAGEPETVVQAPLQAAASRVIIRRGDTLWRISRNTYGRGSRYTVIYLANGDQIRDPNRIYPGQVFRVPDSSDEGQAPRG